VFVGVQNAANAGVPADKAGLAAALISASSTLGGALGGRSPGASPPGLRALRSTTPVRGPGIFLTINPVILTNCVHRS
jgi:hypothetical protein